MGVYSDTRMVITVWAGIAVSFGLHEGVREPAVETDKEPVREPMGSRVLHPPIHEPLPTPERISTGDRPAAVAKREGQAEG